MNRQGNRILIVPVSSLNNKVRDLNLFDRFHFIGVHSLVHIGGRRWSLVIQELLSGPMSLCPDIFVNSNKSAWRSVLR